ncbi:MAG TPA: hypothetical protein VMM76_05420 [Pirellulaceae bacterium]|nr:hypothetical protein [Pirellulaceae bacterium]
MADNWLLLDGLVDGDLHSRIGGRSSRTHGACGIGPDVVARPNLHWPIPPRRPSIRLMAVVWLVRGRGLVRLVNTAVDFDVMASERDKESRWRPRFSVRTLAVAVTLVCCYAACWGPTKRQGVADVNHHVKWPVELKGHVGRYGISSAKAPLIVAFDEESQVVMPPRLYFFWFFGYVAKLPFKGEVDAIPNILLDSPRGTSKQVIP